MVAWPITEGAEQHPAPGPGLPFDAFRRLAVPASPRKVAHAPQFVGGTIEGSATRGKSGVAEFRRRRAVRKGCTR